MKDQPLVFRETLDSAAAAMPHMDHFDITCLKCSRPDKPPLPMLVKYKRGRLFIGCPECEELMLVIMVQPGLRYFNKN